MKTMISALAILTLGVGFASGAKDSSDEFSKDEMRAYFEFFASVVSQCPLDNQEDTIAVMRTLAARLKPQHAQSAAHRNTFPDLKAKTLETFAAIQELCGSAAVELKDGAARLASSIEPIDLGAGIPRYLPIEITNKEEAPVVVFATPLDHERKRTKNSVTIQPGQTVPLFLPLLADASSAKEADLKILSGEAGHSVAVPARVAKPVILKGTIIDGDLGEPFPGRVYVKCSDGEYRHTTSYDDIQTVSQKTILPNVQKNYRLPFSYSDGTFEIAVPPGKTEVKLMRGFEHEVVTETYDLKPGETREVELSSSRLVNMKEHKWISGDTHVHWAKNWWNEDESLDLLCVVQRAEDVQVVNNLTLRHHIPPKPEFIAPTQRPMGPIEDYSDSTYHVQMAEEYRNAPFYGHVNYLNIKELVQPISTGDIMGPDGIDYPTNYTANKECKDQGGIVCLAHGIPVGGLAEMALGMVDCFDQLDPGKYYEALDAGFRMPLGNGSDHPARIVGCARTYVRIEDEFSYAAWIHGLVKKRSFTTSGPLLTLTVNDVEIGDELRVSKGDMLRIKGKVVSRYPIGKLHIVANHKVLIDVESDGTELEFDFEVPAEESCWVVARCSQNNKWNAIQTENVAHTSAIYVLVDGKRIFKKEAAAKYAKQLQQHAENVRRNAKFDNEDQRNEAVQVMLDGARVYEDRIAEGE